MESMTQSQDHHVYENLVPNVEGYVCYIQETIDFSKRDPQILAKFVTKNFNNFQHNHNSHCTELDSKEFLWQLIKVVIYMFRKCIKQHNRASV